MQFGKRSPLRLLCERSRASTLAAAMRTLCTSWAETLPLPNRNLEIVGIVDSRPASQLESPAAKIVAGYASARSHPVSGGTRGLCCSGVGAAARFGRWVCRFARGAPGDSRFAALY